MMVERALKCPTCGGPITASRFARSTICGFCGSQVVLDPSVVSVARFREARAEWDRPAPDASTIAGTHWTIGALVARGECSDVHFAIRARAPTERALVKLGRSPADAAFHEREWKVLKELRPAEVLGPLVALLPDPIARGLVDAGPHLGRHALLLRATPRFSRTIEGLRRPIEPRSTAWVWRRVLELLEVLHRAGVAHGAVLPPHILVQDGDHGARLVGYSLAGAPDEPLPGMHSRFSGFFPGSVRSRRADLQMSARSVAWMLDGAVPGAYGALVERVAREGADGAWELRSEVGAAARATFGEPAFCPFPTEESRWAVETTARRPTRPSYGAAPRSRCSRCSSSGSATRS